MVGLIIAILNAALPLVTAIPEVMALVKSAISLIESGKEPTPQQWQDISAALLAAHQAVQKAEPSQA